MVLPDSKQPDADGRCIVILLGESVVRAALADPDETELATEFSSAHTFTSTQDAVVQTDAALQELGKKSENVNQIIFGIEPSWVDAQGSVIAEHKPLMKKITDGLELKPIGFVVSSEAAVQYCLSHDRLCSAVFVYLQTQHLTLFVVKQGAIVGQTIVGRSGDTIADMTEGLARITRTHPQDAYLPAKINVLGASIEDVELEAQQQLVLEHEWSSSFRFLQTPVVEVITGETLLKRVTLQAMHQPDGHATSSAVVGETDDQPDEAASFGFSQAETEPESSESMEVETDKNDAQLAEDAATAKEYAIEPQGSASLPTSFGVPIASTKVSPEASEKMPHSGGDNHDREKIQHERHGKHSVNKPKHVLGIVIGILVGLIAVTVFGYFWLNSTAKFTVVLTPEQKIVTKQATLSVDPNAATSDPVAGILKGSLITTEVSGEDFIQTTGIKLVGEKAKGSLLVCNNTDSPKNFSAGTKFTSGKFSFLSDKDVLVASASTVAKFGTTTTECGKASVAVTAVEIGTEYNLNKDTKFVVDGFSASTYEAITENSLSGGTSREVRVVSAQDRSKLQTALVAKLLSDAGAKFSEQVAAGSYAVPTGKHSQIAAKFDHAVGEEADTVTLNLTIEAEGVAYTSADLRPLAEALLEQEVPDGYSLLDEDPEILSSPVESTASAKTVKLEAALTAKATANLDADSIKNSVAGMLVTEALTQLQDRDDIAKASIQVDPAAAGLLFKKLPANTDLLLITVAASSE